MKRDYICNNPEKCKGYKFELDENSPYECPKCGLSVFMKKINGCVEGASPSSSNDNTVKDPPPSKPGNQNEENQTTNKSFIKWIKEHKLLTILVCLAVIILIIVLICINQCNDSKPPEKKGIVTVDSTKNDSITVKVFIKDQNIVFDIPEGYKIYFDDDNSEGSLKGNVYDIGKMNDGDLCTFSLKLKDENECSNVKWETLETYPMLEIINNKLVCNKENPKFPPEIICKSTEENEKFKITVTVAKGSADTFCLEKEGEIGNVIEQSSGVFENLEPGIYKVYAKNGIVKCQSQEMSLTPKKDVQSKLTKENIQVVLDKVSNGQMKLSEASGFLCVDLQNIKLSPKVRNQSNLNMLLNDISGEGINLKCESVDPNGENKYIAKIVAK